jgi:hypothetical protein
MKGLGSAATWVGLKAGSTRRSPSQSGSLAFAPSRQRRPIQQDPTTTATARPGYAVYSALVAGSPGAVAQPPKQFGSLSDAGYYSRTNCS